MDIVVSCAHEVIGIYVAFEGIFVVGTYIANTFEVDSGGGGSAYVQKCWVYMPT